MKKIQSLQLIRAIAALAVVLYHATVICGYYLHYALFDGVFLHGFRGVDLFFVLSGFIIMSVHRVDLSKPKRLANYAFNRLSRIYPAVIIVTIASALIYASGFGGPEKLAKVSIGNFFSSLLLLPQTTIPLVNVTWTLKYEMFFYVIFAIGILNIRAGIAAFVLWQFGTLAAIFIHGFSPLTYANYFFQPITLDFGIGILSALAFTRLESQSYANSTRWAFTGTVLSSIILLGIYLFRSHALQMHISVLSLVFGIASGVLILSLALLERAGKLPIPKIAIALGDQSYSIYLIHFSVISLLASAFFHNRIPFTPLTFVFFVAAGIAAGSLFHITIDSRINRYLRSKWKARTAKPVR